VSLTFHEVKKSFDGVPVLQGFSAEVPLQGLTFVVGRSGSGKSVLCRAAVGLLRLDAGEIALDGGRVDTLPERALQRTREQVPYLVQSPALLDWLTLAQNVALPGGTAAEVEKNLARVGLSALGDKRPAEVGPGVRKRAAIARALMLRPRFLLLDEPTTGLDREAAAQVNATLAELRAQGLGALVVSHDFAAAQTFADTVLEVHRGKKGYHGPAKAFRGLTPLGVE